jgi:hypothetical protein
MWWWKGGENLFYITYNIFLYNPDKIFKFKINIKNETTIGKIALENEISQSDLNCALWRLFSKIDIGKIAIF